MARTNEAMILTRKIGASVSIAIDGTARELNCVPLSVVGGYPMTVQLEAQGAQCWLYQGPTGTTLPATNARLLADQYAEITIDGTNDAYIQVKQSSTTSGTLVGTRIDHTGQ